MKFHSDFSKSKAMVRYSLKITSVAEHMEKIGRLDKECLQVLRTTKDLEKERRLWVAARKEIEKKVEPKKKMACQVILSI